MGLSTPDFERLGGDFSTAKLGCESDASVEISAITVVIMRPSLLGDARYTGDEICLRVADEEGDVSEASSVSGGNEFSI